MSVCRALTVVVGVAVPMMSMIVSMIRSVLMVVRVSVALDGGLGLTAAAYCSHHSTSSSFTLIWSPPVTCN